MLRFKAFLLISEELNDSQREEFNQMPRDPKAVKATDHYFGVGNDVVSKPLEGTMDKSEIHKAIERHLGRSISHQDYKNGITNDEYGRQTKLGKLLTKTKAPSTLVNGFANDNTRQGKKFTGLTAITTRSPGGDPSKGDKSGVAGQTSSNQSWQQQSCKNVETGLHKKYLPQEIKHGTVVTYLQDHEGRELARATLQPHINDQGHTAYAVDSHYGIDHAGFKAHAEQLAKDLSGPHKGGSIVYKKHPDVYNDNGYTTMMHPDVAPEHITKALDDDDKLVRLAAISHPKATSEHITKALDDPNEGIRKAALEHPKVTSEHITKALDNTNDFVRLAAIRHPKATSEHITKALDDPAEYIRDSALEHPKVTSEHITKALDNTNDFVRQIAIKHPKATPEHITKALNDPSIEVRRAALEHPKVTSEHITKALNDPSSSAGVRQAAIRHPKATSEHITKALNDPSSSTGVRLAAISHPKATPEHITKALDDTNDFVREIAIRRPNATPEHITKALNDPSIEVRREALKHPKVTSEHITKALDDDDVFRRAAALEHPKVTSEHITKALNDPSREIRQIAMKKQKAK